ncbi:L-Aspartase-like protein [Dactylonectria macrodidyma]|uniref:L-Aspartase-like protein n=1 Tax=Dactylonectria macrodidyma TaxID=307937 RepID=A0A9P9I7L4_9HYPO|nr:L-Aspartase-like protein [Dactylonectria macrodidyma]
MVGRSCSPWRYYQVEIAFGLSMIMTILNDLCTELHIFSSTEFGTVELDDSHCSTSSVFPQKKNPYALETVNGMAAEAQGWVTHALALFRNEGTCDHATRSLGGLGNMCKSTAGMLRLTAEVLSGLTVNKERYEELLSKAWVTTNQLANLLMMQHGLNYRTAHGVVARLVKNASVRNTKREAVTVEMLQQAAEEMRAGQIEMTEEEFKLALDHTRFIENCTSFGGVAPEQFDRLMAKSQDNLKDHGSWVEAKIVHLAHAEKDLEAAVADLLKIGGCT